MLGIIVNFAPEIRINTFSRRHAVEPLGLPRLEKKQMENKLVVNGLKFVPYLTEDEIMKQVKRVAGEIRRDLEGKSPVFLCVLNGAFVFAADLYREIGIVDSQMAFVRYSSYEGTESTGCVRRMMGLPENLEGRDIVIIEDIVDTGLTADKMIRDIKALNPASVRFATLLHKPESTKTGFEPDYVAFSIPPKFIIGYGLDLDGKARNLRSIYVISED